MHDSPKPRLLTRPDILAWAMYDWANSAFSTLSITIIVVFFSNILFPEKIQVAGPDGVLVDQVLWGNWSGSAYAFALAATTLVAGLLSPVVGALADARANKDTWLRVTALAGAGCCLGMAFAPADPPWLATALFMGALFFFELSYGFANAFLPDIATEEQMNRVSAFGFACGYLGGALALGAVLGMIRYGDSAGWSDAQKIRSGLTVMGLWWGIFSLPAIFFLRDRRRPQATVGGETTHAVPDVGPYTSPSTQHIPTSFWSAIRIALADVRRTLGDMRNYKMLALFLVGFLLYNDCVQTVISQSSNFAEKDLGFELTELTMVVLMIQFVALPGALFIGWLSDRVGQKRVLMFCLLVWAAILLAAWFVNEKIHFWIMGACVALVMGGIQSVSRAIMGTMTPPEKSAEFFGFFNLSSKATCFIGPLIFGGVYTLTGNYKLAILSLLVQLVIGAIIVSRVNVEQGRRDARGL